METLRSIFDFSDFPRIDKLIFTIFCIFLFVFPLLPHTNFFMATMIEFLMFSLYGMGWNTIGGYGGQVDLGEAQYAGIGAYTTAVMLIRWNIPFWISAPVGMIFAIIWSFIIGYPLFRTRGHYFAIATIATSLVLLDVFKVWDFVGAAKGIVMPLKKMPSFLYLQFRNDTYYYYILLFLFFMGFFYINWFRKSRLGFQLRAIKDNEEVARSLGINARWCKIKAYAIAASFVAVVGSFHACYNFNIEPGDIMSLDLSILIAMMAMVGGAGSLWGPIIGAAVLIPLKSYLGSWLGGKAGLAGLDLVIYALIIMAIAALEPKGVWGIVEKARRRKRT